MKVSNKTMYDLLWMSMRYCIGRHTIATSNHAYEIANIIYDNPGALSNFELTRLAIDIRDEIIGILRWDPRIKITGTAAGHDMYSELLYTIQTIDDPHRTLFEYNAAYKVFETYPLGDTNLERVRSRAHIDCDYADLIPWVKLANALDKSTHKKIVCEWEDDKGKKHIDEDICFPYPARVKSNDGFRYFKAWTPVKAALCRGLLVQSWISEDVIKEIKDI